MVGSRCSGSLEVEWNSDQNYTTLPGGAGEGVGGWESRGRGSRGSRVVGVKVIVGCKGGEGLGVGGGQGMVGVWGWWGVKGVVEVGVGGWGSKVGGV